MRLGFHYHIPAIQKDDAIIMPGYLGRFIDSLAAECEQVVCFQHSPRTDEMHLMDYAINANNVSLVPIGVHTSIPKRMLSIPTIKKIVKQHAQPLDIMLIRGPSPLLPAVASACSPVPTALLLVGDYMAGIDSLPQPPWRRELIRLWSFWNETMQTRQAKRSLTFVNSHMLFEKLKDQVHDLVETRTTTLTKDDFYWREDTCQQQPIRLLYTGRMDPAKGLMDMAQALKILVEKGYDVVLDLVGMEEGTNILNELAHYAESTGMKGRIVYHGFKSVGPELFAYYQNADIYVIASQTSEGFPRTICEAMAHGLPVVATKVGSIPDFISQTGFLVDPKKPQALAETIIEVVVNASLRRERIQKGYVLAQENTLEERSNEMVDHIRNYLQQVKR